MLPSKIGFHVFFTRSLVHGKKERMLSLFPNDNGYIRLDNDRMTGGINLQRRCTATCHCFVKDSVRRYLLNYVREPLSLVYI